MERSSRPKFTASAFRTMVEIEEDDGSIDGAKAEVEILN